MYLSNLTSEDFSSTDFNNPSFLPDPGVDIDGFLPGDWRNQFNNWIRDNKNNEDKYLKIDTVYFQLLDFLSAKLAHKTKRGVTESQARYDIGWCGKKGEYQVNSQTGEKRHLGYYCNHRDVHLPCAIRYRRGQGVALRELFTQIINTTKCWGVYSWTFTLPDHVREWLETECFSPEDFLRDCRRGISQSIKQSLGINTKNRDSLPGFFIVYHPVSSSNPLKPSAHFHAVILPIIVSKKSQKITHLPKKIDHNIVKKHYKKAIDKLFHKYGIQKEILELYVVHLQYTKADNKRKIQHIFKYVNRSAAEDVIKIIKRTTGDFNNFIGVFWDQKTKHFIPKKIDLYEILKALEFVLRPLVQIRVSYGFLRVIDRYLEVLGLQCEDFTSTGEWEKIYGIDIHRVSVTSYNIEKKKVEKTVSIFIRQENTFEEYIEIYPWLLVGETFYMEKSVRYKERGS